jgi:hypothetical protein
MWSQILKTLERFTLLEKFNPSATCLCDQFDTTRHVAHVMNFYQYIHYKNIITKSCNKIISHKYMDHSPARTKIVKFGAEELVM